ncbi:hypothetical protein [Anaerocolumna xylanovorans]|uniref:DUF4358 domain-containing protein n=1 Tax=Anaerocolumna xylanovorans DSM 12503 TaxID=1121345 RepID=A0A1M7XWU0_9FIRM|nr:hypothetical protein [Anaerocolumna xylanovorans]SHO43248.1 hypothetical protein SAMN02745217_00144 [Anaerocolumna xylanovorans DSM 12503]
MFKKIMSMMMIAVLVIGLGACSKSAKDTVTKGPEGEPGDIINKIYEQKDPGLKLETTKLDLTDSDKLKYYLGLTDASLIKEAAVSEAMITSQAYSLVLVRVKDSKDTEKAAKEMLDGIDQRKWICVMADDLKVAACGDIIMLIMVQSQIADTVTSDQLVDAFKIVCGGKLDQTLAKDE